MVIATQCGLHRSLPGDGLGAQAGQAGALCKVGLREALVTVFLMVTAPVSAHLMARAGLQAGLAERPPQPSTGARANVEEADQEQPST